MSFGVLVIIYGALHGTERIEAQQLAMVASLESQNRACVARAPGSSDATQRSGVTVSGARGDEQRLVHSAIGRINALAGGGRLSELRGLQIRFKETLGRPRTDGGCLPASQMSGAVEIARRCAPGARVQENNIIGSYGTGLLVHEIGHYVGNRGGYRGYPGGCRISQYCTHSMSGRPHSAHQQKREEFAEVFAAYVLQPDRLRRHPGCQAAYQHLRRMFGGQEPGRDCGSGQPGGAPATMMAQQGRTPGVGRPQAPSATQVAGRLPPPSRAARAPAAMIASHPSAAHWPYYGVDPDSAHGFWLGEQLRREQAARAAGRRPAR
ncbi:MAG TPA: hypothetical protein PLZ57_07715 [Pseudobdellovibrionaceae bacterium]|nr:hypothetical protein [Pseudobdellovibrionaceae bacterium]